MNFLNTFRGRLLLILALMLVATLSVQYYLNLVTQQDNEKLRDAQTRALVTGIALGSNGITSREYMSDFVQREDQPFFDEAIKARIKDIMVIDEEWKIADSLDESIGPRFDDAGNAVYTKLSDIKGLPRLAEADRIGGDVNTFQSIRVLMRRLQN